VRLRSVTLPDAARCAGQTVGDQALHAVGVQVVSLRPAGGGAQPASDSHVLAPGDTLVLSGLPEPLSLAEEKLLRG
jgi:CPA2 family monovalent cation:H+ antiporter-2